MQLLPLSLDSKFAWAELLGISFDRPIDDMMRLLEWFHKGHTVIAWGAWDGKRLVAQYACLLLQLCLPDVRQPVPVGLSLNMAVHPDYRGQGLIKRVSRPVYQVISERQGIAGIGFSNADGVKVDRHSKSYGYRVIGRMQPSLLWLSHSHDQSLELTTEWPHGNWCNIPMSREAIHFPICPEYLLHRYAQHPFRRYDFGVWRENSNIRGIVIYRPVRLGSFAGASLLGAYSADMPELLSRWAQAMRNRGVYLIHALTTPQSQLRGALSHIGKIIDLPYSRSPYFLTVKPLNNDLPDSFFQFSTWDFVGGDVL